MKKIFFIIILINCVSQLYSQIYEFDHYRNGDPIPQVNDSTEWVNLTTGAWCYYNEDANNGKAYGKLYNWYAVNDSRGLAPIGWHIPSDEEWTSLSDYLGGDHVSGGKLKDTSTKYWYFPNSVTKNGTDFAALPGGFRNYDGFYKFMKSKGVWWSSSERDTSFAWYRFMESNNNALYRYDLGSLKICGFSVRCVKD
jgi:uncharacterized protein (TIGR02145 family)